jgi:hypothetical protein
MLKSSKVHPYRRVLEISEMLTVQVLREKCRRDTSASVKALLILESPFIKDLGLLSFLFGPSWRERRPMASMCARRAIRKIKQCPHRVVLGWMAKIYYLKFLCASESTLTRCPRLHLQSLAPILFSTRVDVRQATGLEKKLLNLCHNMVNNILYWPHLG